MANIDALYEVCEYLDKDLEKMNEKIRAAGSTINNDTLTYLDKLTHAIKSVKTTIAMEESEHDGSYGRGSYNYGGNRSYGGSYDGDGGSYRGSYDGSYDGGMSNARGRGKNAPRDRFGQYKSSYDGYSHDSGKKEMMKQLNDIMQNAPDERTRSEIANFMNAFDRA